MHCNSTLTWYHGKQFLQELHQRFATLIVVRVITPRMLLWNRIAGVEEASQALVGVARMVSFRCCWAVVGVVRLISSSRNSSIHIRRIHRGDIGLGRYGSFDWVLQYQPLYAFVDALPAQGGRRCVEDLRRQLIRNVPYQLQYKNKQP